MFEYCVCQVQYGVVTFVNDQWQGTKPMTPDDPEAAFETCPKKWDYLNWAGSEGWELISVVSLTHVPEALAQEFYLKRPVR